MNTKISLSKILPVLMSFFVMSFVDLVGISVDRVSSDMDLSATLAQLIPMATFLWFFLLSVPVGIIQARYGKRFVLNAGMVLTAAGLLIPFISYSFGMVLAGFALIGIGNTIVQVSANPLLLDVVPSNRASSFLSFSQFVKAVGSMIGAPLAAVFASQFGDWKLEFLVFGIISLLAVIWLGSVKIEERKEEGYRATLKTSFGLLGNSYILMMVVAIFLVVGVDVGFNSNSGQFLMKHFGIEQTAAESGRSVYFFGRMLGTFLGAIMLTRIQAPRFLMWTTILSIASVAVLLVIPSKVAAWGLVFLTGLAVANIWPLIFSLTVGRFPERSSEISGLMIMAVSGGAPIPFLIGWISDISNIVLGMSVLIVCLIYIFAVSVYNLKKI
ncbi:MAG TPA: MFS transporter [Bacteroidales bacterium]|nr:MFS transporter [Bacteroidales bacterium]HOK74190.1 MFS transporter [Bacteroidales bacterium]HOM39999.1 MFS transporter [Bacteroidales bacterium]HOU30004.1 MFS transporter [Bacteroidales bacterium]HPP92202.1 MFS transporter [Bacteroidales bacterium]